MPAERADPPRSWARALSSSAEYAADERSQIARLGWASQSWRPDPDPNGGPPTAPGRGLACWVRPKANPY